MLKSVKKTMYNIGDGTGYFAKRVGTSTAELAKRIGPKRAIIGAAILGAIVGASIVLVRVMRARREELSFEGSEERGSGRRARAVRQARRRSTVLALTRGAPACAPPPEWAGRACGTARPRRGPGAARRERQPAAALGAAAALAAPRRLR